MNNINLNEKSNNLAFCSDSDLESVVGGIEDSCKCSKGCSFSIGVACGATLATSLCACIVMGTVFGVLVGYSVDNILEEEKE